MLASSISQGSGAGWPGVLCRGPTWLTARLWMSSHLRSVIAIGWFTLWFYSRPTPPSCFGKYVVSICVSTDLSEWRCQVGGCQSQGCHGYPMCPAQFDSWPHLASFLSTIPQAYLLLMSLNPCNYDIIFSNWKPWLQVLSVRMPEVGWVC